MEEFAQGCLTGICMMLLLILALSFILYVPQKYSTFKQPNLIEMECQDNVIQFLEEKNDNTRTWLKTDITCEP